jgi:formate dehydrogenase iron-sulfur subunit
VHRLQGLRGRVQAVERPARRRLAVREGASPTTTPASSQPRPGGTSDSSRCSNLRRNYEKRRSAGWRTPAEVTCRRSPAGAVDIVEAAQSPAGGIDVAEPAPNMGDWVFMSDVRKHCTNAGCLDVFPTGALIRTEHQTVCLQPDVCNGCGYCVPACPFGVLDRDHIDGRAGKCTLCYDRLEDGLEPARAKSCPTDSIQFGPYEELWRSRLAVSLSCTGAASRLRICTARATIRMSSSPAAWGVLPADRAAGAYGLPASADSPVQESVVPATLTAVAAGLLASAGAAVAFMVTARRGSSIRRAGARRRW